MSILTAKQISEAAKEALDNWDFDVMSDEYSDKYIADFKEALNFNEDYAAQCWPDGMEVSNERDIWDNLDEFAHNMASQLI